MLAALKRAKQSSKPQPRYLAGTLNGRPVYIRLKKPPKKKRPTTLADRIVAEFAPMLSVDRWFAYQGGGHGNRWSQEELTGYYRDGIRIKRDYHKKSHHPGQLAAWELAYAADREIHATSRAYSNKILVSIDDDNFDYHDRNHHRMVVHPELRGWYCDSKSSGRHHTYLKVCVRLDEDPKEITKFLKGDFARAIRKKFGPRIEVKGAPSWWDGNRFNFGAACALPNFRSWTEETLASWKAMRWQHLDSLRVWAAQILAEPEEVPEPKYVYRHDPQTNTLIKQVVVFEFAQVKTPEPMGLGKETSEDSIAELLDEPDAFRRDLSFFLTECRQAKRVLELEEALQRKHDAGCFTAPWAENERKRRSRVASVLKYIARTFDSGLAAGCFTEETLDQFLPVIREHFPLGYSDSFRGKFREFTPEHFARLCALLVEFCKNNRNADGGMPTVAFKGLVNRLRAQGKLPRGYNFYDLAVVREFLAAAEAFRIDRHKHSGHAWCWKSNPRFDLGRVLGGRQWARNLTPAMVLQRYRAALPAAMQGKSQATCQRASIDCSSETAELPSFLSELGSASDVTTNRLGGSIHNCVVAQLLQYSERPMTQIEPKSRPPP